MYYTFILSRIKDVETLQENTGDPGVRIPLQTNSVRLLQFNTILKPAKCKKFPEKYKGK
jgi:hypothetical protein